MQMYYSNEIILKEQENKTVVLKVLDVRTNKRFTFYILDAYSKLIQKL